VEIVQLYTVGQVVDHSDETGEGAFGDYLEDLRLGVTSLLGARDGAIIDLAAIDHDLSGELVRCRGPVVKRRHTVPHALDLGVVDAEQAEHRRVEGNAE
jgi:hypothetical protein